MNYYKDLVPIYLPQIVGSIRNGHPVWAVQKHESEFALSVKREECDVSHLPMEITEKEKYINIVIATSIET